MDNEQDPPNRKHPAHHAFIEGHNKSIILFLTLCSHQRRNILATGCVHKTLINVWSSSSQWLVGRYVIMPDHIHLFCSPVNRESENVVKWTTYWKRMASRKLPDLQPIWQRDCWDTQLRRHESYSEKWAYVRHNPVRAGLVEHPDQWPYQGTINHLPW